MIILRDSEKQQEYLGSKESYKSKGIILLTIYLKNHKTCNYFYKYTYEALMNFIHLY